MLMFKGEIYIPTKQDEDRLDKSEYDLLKARYLKKGLDIREAKLIILKYHDPQKTTEREMAKKMKLSQARVHKIIKKALMKLTA